MPSGANAERHGAARAWRGPLVLFAVALALRLGAMAALDGADAAPGGGAWAFGHEPACLARALVDGRGFADPWCHGTGPSSWLTPPYPALLALLMLAFGGVGAPLATALFLLQAVASAATCALMRPLGRALGGEREGALAAWLFALYPVAISNAVQLVWDTTFTALALVAAFVALARVGASLRSASLAGLAFGALVFLNPAPLSIAPVALWFAWRRGGTRAAAAFAVGAFAVCAPWMVRNQMVLDAFTLRPNLGVEMRIGNHDQASGHPQPTLFHPSHVPEELALYRELGEAGYARENLRRALDWIAAHPARFAALCARRVQYFWLGDPPTADARRSAGEGAARDPASWVKFACFAALGVLGLAGVAALRVARDTRILLGASLVLFGVPYYVTHVSERYRFPIEPLLALSAAGALARLPRKAGRGP